MKPLLTLLAAATVSTASASNKILKINIDGVRNEQGLILAKASAAGTAQPSYGMADARKGTVEITLSIPDAESVEVAIIHDEDGDYQMKMGHRGPREGWARQRCELPEATNTAHLHISYPDGGKAPEQTTDQAE